ncbi:hypothetical protein RJT34_25351 [Clitoria ternatea]|uniref:Uncharacterized protein n=1 Tax=Clitoria ternatea TaxID=43366 RepID=A0AAN9FPQ7_CLITE
MVEIRSPHCMNGGMHPPLQTQQLPPITVTSHRHPSLVRGPDKERVGDSGIKTNGVFSCDAETGRGSGSSVTAKKLTFRTTLIFSIFVAVSSEIYDASPEKQLMYDACPETQLL